MSDYISVGYTQKSHGVKGEIKIKILDDYLEDVLDAEIVFIKLKGAQLPFFPENFRGSGNLLIAKFEDVNSPEKADSISSSEIFLRPQDVQPIVEAEEEEELEYSYLIGFDLHDSNLGNLGSVKDVLEYPQQEMALIAHKNKEILIPLNDQLIVKIDAQNKIVEMNLPEGLLDL